MITLITGSPGAGKTAYTVQEYVKKIVGTSIIDPETGIEYPRKIYTNINQLKLDHDLIDEREDGGLNGWHNWMKPAEVVVYDEVQKVWPKRPNGSKRPDYIGALETHRHHGVDLYLITQGTNLIDQDLFPLIGRHIYVRHIFGRRCIVYEWDHVSRGLLFSKAINKSVWTRKRETEKLYKSSSLHVKQSKKVPGLIWIMLIALCFGIWKIPAVLELFNRGQVTADSIASAAGGSAANAIPAQQHQEYGTTYKSPDAQKNQSQAPDERVDFLPAVSDRPWTAPAFDGLRQVQDLPYPDGAMCMQGQCTCYRAHYKLEMSSDACRKWMQDRPHNPYKAIQEPQQQHAAVTSVDPNPVTIASQLLDKPK